MKSEAKSFIGKSAPNIDIESSHLINKKRKSMKKILISIGFIVVSTLAFAHGEDKMGPNGGFVRMPGAFHTEVVVNLKNTLKVYLLDIDWNNPSVLKSEVKATVLVAKNTEDAVCTAKDNYFLCTFSRSVNLKKKSELLITANREGKR